MLSRIPQHKNDSIPASINSTSISPPCENIEPESLVPNYTSTTAESGRTDPSSGHTRTGGDAPVCIPKTRRRKRIERPKTIDLGSMSDREQLLLSLQQRKVFSFDPITTSFDLIWPFRPIDRYLHGTDLSFVGHFSEHMIILWNECWNEFHFIPYTNFGYTFGFFARVTLFMNDLCWDDPKVCGWLDRQTGRQLLIVWHFR